MVATTDAITCMPLQPESGVSGWQNLYTHWDTQVRAGTLVFESHGTIYTLTEETRVEMMSVDDAGFQNLVSIRILYVQFLLCFKKGKRNGKKQLHEETSQSSACAMSDTLGMLHKVDLILFIAFFL